MSAACSTISGRFTYFEYSVYHHLSIFFLGGGGNGPCQKNEVIDIKGQEPCLLPDFQPSNFQVLAGVLTFTAGDNKMITCGAYNGLISFNQCFELDVPNTSWKNHSDFSDHYMGNVADVTMPNGLYFLGGDYGGWNSAFLPAYSNVWEEGIDCPMCKDGNGGACAVKISDEEFVMIGGWIFSDLISKYNIVSGLWTTIGHLTFPRSYHTCVFKNGGVMVIAGSDSDGPVLTTELINVSDGTSRNVGDLNIDRKSTEAVIIQNTVMILGGHDANPQQDGSIEIWNEEEETWTLAEFSLKNPRRQLDTLVVPRKMACSTGSGN